MPTPTAFSKWTRPIFPAQRFYLDGRWYDFWPEGFEGGGGVSWQADQGAWVVRTHAADGVVFRPFRDAGSADTAERYSFSKDLLGDSEADFVGLQIARSRGALVDFFPGIPVVDVFSGAVSGQAYTLNRPLAAGIVSPPPELLTLFTDWTPDVYLNGASFPSSASVSGQTVTAAASGEIAVCYLPVFRVMLTLGHQVPEGDQLVMAVSLQEELVLA